MTADYNRRPNGKFGPGNDGGPGRPKREIEAEYLNATVAAVSIEDWAKVVQAMLNFAKSGNVQAATWLANYIVGRPTEHIAITAEEPDRYVLELPRGSEDSESEDLPALESGNDQ
jgi:hypothetical protein